MSDNMRIWRAVEEVDPAFTRPIEGAEFSGTMVNLTYTCRKLTEQLGPAGLDWGWEVIAEGFVEYGEHENQSYQSIHWMRVRLWMRREDGTTGHIEDYGTTKVAYYAGKPGKRYLRIDGEFAKKTISDAKSKLFVALGGSAEVWMGHFDPSQHKHMAPEAESGPPSEPSGPEPVEVPAATVEKTRRFVAKQIAAGAWGWADPASGEYLEKLVPQDGGPARTFASAFEAAGELAAAVRTAHWTWGQAAVSCNEPLVGVAGDEMAKTIVRALCAAPGAPGPVGAQGA